MSLAPRRCYTDGMRHRRRLAAGLGLALCVLAGCSGDDPPPLQPDAAWRQGPTAPEPSLPGPSVDAPGTDLPPDQPRMALRPAVDLSPAVPGVAATATAAVGSPDGGAYVVLSPLDPRLPHRLATVSPVDAGHAVTASVPVPRLRPVWDVHALATGRVLISGQFRGDRPGYGFLSVDPARGDVWTAVVIPFEDGTELASGSSVLSADGTTITLFLSSFTNGRHLDLLMSADAASGQILGGRDLSEEVGPVSESGVGPWSTWLFARPDGGVDLVFDAYPARVGIVGVPTVVRYDRELEPVGKPMPVTGGDDSARLLAAAIGPDGTVVVRAEVPDGTWLVELSSDGASSTRLVHLAGPGDDALVVDPAQGWALMPTAYGARTVDLATGGSTPVDVGCSPGVDQLLPGLGGVSALMVGRCGPRGADVPTLWIAGPTQ